MNKIFKVVWNEARRAYVVVSEYAKAQGKGCSGKKLLAMLIAAGVLSCPMFNVAEAETLGEASQENYVAIKIENPSTSDPDHKEINGYTYNKKSATYTEPNGQSHTVYYYVRDGYTIQAEYNHLFNFDQISGAGTDYTISTYRTESADDTVLFKSNQVLVTASSVKTLTDATINDAKTGTFVGSSNSEGVKADYGWNYIIYDSDGKYVDVRSKMETYFQEAEKNETTGQYMYNGEVIAPENLYVLTKTETQTVPGKWPWVPDKEVTVERQVLGFFKTKDGALYKGSVFGLHNEVLMTTKDGDTLYSYWGAETDDPNQTITNMKVGQLNAKFDVINNNIKTAMGDDIASIETKQTATNTGTINLLRRGVYNSTTGQYEGIYDAETGGDVGEYSVAGGLTMTSVSETGKDVKIKVSGIGEDGASSYFTIDAGSKVEANNGNGGTNLNTITINGESFNVVGKEYTQGTGIEISESGVISSTVVNTTYSAAADNTGKSGNQVNIYKIKDNNDNVVGTIVDTDTKYTITSATGTGNVKTTYTITPNDGSDPTTIVDTDTNTTYAQGNGVTIIGDDNTIAVKTATNAGLIVDGDGVTVNVDDSLSKVDNVISVNKDRVTLSYKANGANGQTVSLANGLNFVNGTNTNATIAAGGVVTFDLKDNISLSSVTTGDVSMSADGLNAGSKVISNVANGSADNDAVNVSQLADAKTELNTSITNNYNTLNGNDIASIKTESTSTGGTINLIKNGGQTVAGGLTITSGGGSGSDTFITIAGKNGEAASAITLNTGSKVSAVGTTDNLTGVTINGTSYNIKPYIGGDNVTITGNVISATDTNTTYKLVESTDQKQPGQVKIYEIRTDDANNTLIGKIVDTDTDTTYAQGNGVTINGNDNTIAVKTATNAGLTVDQDGVSVNVGSGLTKNNNVISVDNSAIDLAYKANGGSAETVKLNNGLNFSDGTNTNATITAGGVVTFDLKDNISLSSVTTGDVVMNASGLTTGTTVISDDGVAIGTNTSLTASALTIGGKAYVTTSGLNANNQKITNVANGTDTYDAVNYGQLQSAISGGTSTNDIKSIQTKSDGTINLIRNDETGSKVDGGLTFTSEGGTGGADKSIKITGMNGDAASTITLNAGSVVTGTDSDTDGYLDSLTINGNAFNIRQYTEGAGINIANNAISVDVGDGMKIDGDKVAAKLGAGLGLDTAKAITVLAEQNKGISVSDNGIGVIANTNKGITVDASGVAVKIDNNSLTFDDNGYIKVNTALTSLKYRANGAAQPLSVSLDQGLDFKNGTNTTASVDVNGEVKYDLNTDVTLTDGSLIVTDADGAGNVVIQNGSITGPGYALRNDGSVSFANGSFSIASNGNITSSFGNGGHILADNNGFGVSQGNSTLAVTNDGVGLSKTNEDGVKSAVAVTDNGVGITSGESALVVGAGGTVIKGGLDMMNEKITGVAAGEADTDAVNVSQLKAAAAAANTKVEEGKNIDVTSTTAEDGSKTYTVALEKDVELANGSLKVTGTAGDVLIQNGAITGSGYGLYNDGSVSFANGSFSIASNGNITSSFGNGGHILADNNGFGVSQGNATLAVTNDGVGLSKTNEDGVKSAVAVTDNGVGITSGESALVVGAGGTVIKGGLDMMNEKITGVAAGEADTDAVNVSQLKAAAAAANTKVAAGDNITVSTAISEEDGSKTYTVALDKDVELEDGSLTVTGDDGNVLIQNGSITGPGYALRNNGSVSFANGKFDIGSDGSIKSAYSDNGRISADAQGFGVSKGGSMLSVTDAGVAASKGDSALAVTEGGVGITSGKTTVVVSDSGLNVGGSKITGVAKGEISSTSTDAVNGSQLNEVQNQVNNIDGRVTTIEGKVTTIEGDITTIKNDITEIKQTAGKHTTVITDASEKNLTISKGTNGVGGKEYTITINRDMDLDSVTTGNTVMSNDGISFKDSDTKLTSSGLTVGDTIVDGDGISIKTEEGKETYITKDGINANDKKITNVADGDVSKDSTDAVNGSQLHATNEYISNVANQVADNSSRINKLGRRVDKVGAGSAALAALHPLDFDPDDKLTFSAGVGNYHGQNAAAIGAFYRPTEKIMVSVGGTVGNDENMVNAGISFALDRTNNVSNSRTAMAREIVDLRAQVANLTALVTKLISDKTGADPAAMFPDVPANHWAYEYINGLAMQGIIEGYPDGTFQGDATMTRYEFATMLFKAMEKGAVLSDRLREEFKNELGRIRVDRIKGADNDAGKIERVRVNEGADRDDYGTKLQAKG